MPVTFQKATKKQLKARIALLGPAGSGKTYTSLRVAYALAGPEGKVAAIDTEHRSLSKYVGEAPDGKPWDFDVLELSSFSPDSYIEGIKAAEAAGYDVLVIDSLSHAWAGKDGLLEFVDETARKNRIRSGSSSENTFNAWREATPKHNALVETMLASRLHLIVTMRVKQEYVQEKDSNNKTTVRKIGLQPVQRDGLEYEFDVIADLDADNNLIVSKSRCSALHGKLFSKAGPEIARTMLAWLSSGVVDERPAPAPAQVQEPAPAQESAAPQRWQDDKTQQQKLLTVLAEKKVTPTEAKSLLNLTAFSAFNGSFDDLIAALDDRIRARDEAKIAEAVKATA